VDNRPAVSLKWVRQSRRYPLWRVSHAYHPDVAVRLICWFPPDSGTVVVALFAGDKSRIGDVFYNSVSSRADALIDQWKRETSYGEAMTEPDNKIFVCGNAHLDRLLSDPEIAAGVAEAHAAAEEMDRTYAMNLAMIRKAGQMTQVEVAKKLGVGQGVVFRLENRDDMLLSTLFDWIAMGDK